MAKFYRIGGEVYRASSPRHLVAQMNSRSFSPSDTDEQFMAEVAFRTTLQDGTKPRTHDWGAFVEDLMKDGLVEEIPCT